MSLNFKTEIISSIISDNSMKLEINTKRKTGKFTSTKILNNTPLNNQWVQEDIRREI